MGKPLFLFVVGTRPDAIKTAPVVLEARKHGEELDVLVVSTGQHREMLDQALAAFGITAGIDLALMKQGQSLAELTARALTRLDQVLTERNPAMVFAQGDTTSTFVAGLASFYRQIPFSHIEAGLRTPTVWDPFPEEFNRRAVSHFAALHFAPTSWAAENLMREGVASEKIFVTGNTGIDAVLKVAAGHKMDWYPGHKGRVMLLTTHRRENWGEPQARIARAARQLVEMFEDLMLIVPMHKNPAVRDTLTSVLSDAPRTHLIEPPDYADFVKLVQRSNLILTDSGGVQEEAPSFGVPVLVLRETTERPEGVVAGNARLVGTDVSRIVEEASKLLTSEKEHRTMSQAASPYGDGRASARVVAVAMAEVGLSVQKVPMWE